MAKTGAHVFEIANRVTTNNDTGKISLVADNLSNHQNASNTDAHQISNISGLQAVLNGKQDMISGYTGNVSVVVGVDFTSKTVTTVKMKIVNGIITEIS